MSFDEVNKSGEKHKGDTSKLSGAEERKVKEVPEQNLERK